jgi:hypothetical protein
MDPTRRGRVIDADAPADRAGSPAGCTVDVGRSADFLAGGADLLADVVEVPPGWAVELDRLAVVGFETSADSSAGFRALPFTANELS